MPGSREWFKGIELFEALTPADQDALAAATECLVLAPGELLFSAGEPGEALFVVRSGTMEVFVKDNIGQKLILASPEKGEIFGELALVDSGPRTATARAITSAELISLNRDGLLLLFQKRPETAIAMLAGMSRMTRKADELLRTRVTQNVNVEEEEQLTFGARIADRVAAFGGSWTFIILFGAVLAGWMAVNAVLSSRAFDPYPFILLNLLLSTLAAIQAPFIMMSQNRLASKDRLRADQDYEVNLKSELEIAHLHEKVDRNFEAMLNQFAKISKKLP